MPLSIENPCTHSVLRTTPSPFADNVGYHNRSSHQLFTASTGSRKRGSPSSTDILDVYPAPLVLPEDELAQDPGYPAQSFVAWKNEKDRNAIVAEKAVVYVAEYPGWKDPKLGKLVTRWSSPDQGVGAPASPPPPVGDVLAYLQAFFHGLPVRRLDDTLAFTSWTDPPSKVHKYTDKDTSKCPTKSSKSSSRPPFVGLTSSTSNIKTRIRVRFRDFPKSTNPLRTAPEPYSVQLNLNDLLDHAISIAPSDAYALLLLVNHDLYEDEDDDFCVGRAYGGSRIAVVSGARYRPELDRKAGIDLAAGHWWPGSHCENFVQDMCDGELKQNQKGKKRKVDIPRAGLPNLRSTVPLQEAVVAHNAALQEYVDNPAYPQSFNLYTRRICLTASHELLHCFGLDHCVYFACAMQGTSCLAEDSRQPPYLCPICENKLAAAIVLRIKRSDTIQDQWWEGKEVRQWKEERMKALIRYCEGQEHGGLAFAALSVWYGSLLSRDQGLEAVLPM